MFALAPSAEFMLHESTPDQVDVTTERVAGLREYEGRQGDGANLRMMSCKTTTDIDQPLSVTFEFADAQPVAAVMMTSCLNDASCARELVTESAVAPSEARVTSTTSSASQMTS